MYHKITKTAIIISIIILGISCQDPDEPVNGIPNCEGDKLELVSDGMECKEPDFFLICESINVEDMNCLSQDDLQWIPFLYKDIGETIEYKTKNGDSFDMTITGKNHFIHETRRSSYCPKSIEHVTYICQKNETAYFEFMTPFFGADTTQFELAKPITSYIDQELGDPSLRYSINQPRTGTNVSNFYQYSHVANRDSSRNGIFHEHINLGEKEYKDIYEHKIRETFHAEPHMSIYIKKEYGILAFYMDGSYWILDD